MNCERLSRADRFAFRNSSFDGMGIFWPSGVSSDTEARVNL